MKVVAVSENTLLIVGEQCINDENTSRIRQLTSTLQQAFSSVIIDIIPAYASIHITFNVLIISVDIFIKKIEKIISDTEIIAPRVSAKKIIDIPTYYGDEVALDLSLLANNLQLSVEDIIRIHSEKIYDVYAIGFSPGFAYLGHVDTRIASPRKQEPRKKVAQGSVGIADQQTAIYPTDSPGGWQIIGRTPLALLDYSREPLSIFTVGDQVKFIPISKKEYCALGGQLL